MNKILLFDYDGVLVDSITRNVAAGATAAKNMGHETMPVATDVHHMHEVSFEELGRIIGIPGNLQNRYAHECFKALNNMEKPAEFFPDVKDVIHRLNGEVIMGIVTGNTSKEVHTQLSIAGLQDFFSPVLGIETPGSKCEKIVKIMTDAQVSAQNTWMIGDSASDIREANKAKVNSIAATWGYQPRELLEAENPDILIDSLSEILEHVL